MKTRIIHLTTVHARTDTRIRYKEVETVSTPEPETGPGVELILDHPDECVICLDPGVNYALPCTHKFHKECILKWFKKVREQNEAQECPICRCNV